MINSMRGCVACDDLWPWPISSRSFGLDLENCVCSVVSTVLDGFFLYMAQMITVIRGCVACCVFFRIWKFEFLANFWNFSALTLKKKSAVLDGFFPYLAQMITRVRGCVSYNDLWPWPISSRSFGLGLENRVCSVASTVPDGFFPYLAQMITSMRRCVACDDLWPWPISSRWQGHSTLFWFGTQHDSIVWVIMRQRGVSSERRRSSWVCFSIWQAEPWWRASIWRSHRKVVVKQCSYHNNIIDIQNRLPYSKVVYPAIIVLFSCLMEINHGVRTGPDYPFR